MSDLHTHLHAMTLEEINQACVGLLVELLERCTINLVSDLTGLSRTTLYRWLDESVPLAAMDVYRASWFILFCETSPKARLLLSRPPLSHPRMARKLLEDVQ